jgi:hypothetical protein
MIDTGFPTPPELGCRLAIVGVGITAKAIPLLCTPPTMTTTFPDIAPVGTGTTICVAVQLVGTPVAVAKVTVLRPWLDPKLLPVTVTESPLIPEVGARLVIWGAATPTSKPYPLLVTAVLDELGAVTTTFPVVAPAGTGTTICVALQLVGVASVPLNFTVVADP